MINLHRTGPLLHELCCDGPLGAAACPFSLLTLSVRRYTEDALWSERDALVTRSGSTRFSAPSAICTRLSCSL